MDQAVWGNRQILKGARPEVESDSDTSFTAGYSNGGRDRFRELEHLSLMEGGSAEFAKPIQNKPGGSDGPETHGDGAKSSDQHGRDREQKPL